MADSVVDPTATARRAEVREGIDGLRRELAGWPAAVELLGDPGQHRTQVSSVTNALAPVLDRIEKAFVEAGTGTVGRVYEAGRGVDRQIAFCRRVWRWFADRWDQRADGEMAPVLHGADELVWSVWKTMFAAAGVDPTPAPLPFIDDEYVASATVRTAPPLEVKAPSRDKLLSQYIDALPVPVIGLPAAVLRRPWWLVVVLHETGHHLQHDLGPGIVDSVTNVLAEDSARSGAPRAESEAWGRWGRELFADAVAATCAGTAACWMVAELERRDPAGLVVEPTSWYPPPVVREAVVREIVRVLGVTPPAPRLTVEDRLLPSAVRGELQRVPDVVASLLSVKLGATSLGELGQGLVGREKVAVAWRKRFEPNQGVPIPVRELGAAPACINGSVKAWSKFVAADPATDPERLRSLVVGVLPECREDGVRATAAALIADELVDRLVGALPGNDLP